MPAGSIIEWAIGIVVILAATLAALGIGLRIVRGSKAKVRLNLKTGEAQLEPETAQDQAPADRPTILADMGVLRQIVALEVERAMLPEKALREARSIVREGVVSALATLRRLARDFICEHSGCSDGPEGEDDFREYERILEAAQSHVMATIMEAVERNHFHLFNATEWERYKGKHFLDIYGTTEAFIEARFKPRGVEIKDMRESIFQKRDEFRTTYEHIMDRCMWISQRTRDREKEIEQEVDQALAA